MAAAPPSLDPHGRDVERQVDSVADEYAAGLEHAIPGEPVVGAVESPVQAEGETLAVLVVGGRSVQLAVEQDRASDAPDRQFAGQGEVAAVAVEVHPDGVEVDLGE